MPGRLDGKVAIVTGAATGLGREIARLYAEEGAKVVVADIRAPEAQETVEAIRAAGGQAVFASTDVTKSDDVRAAVALAESEFGKLDIMTANAGILGRGSWERLEDTSEEDFEQVIDINLGGVFRCFKYAIPAIRRAGGGAMSVTASNAAHLGFPRLDAYCASKAGAVALVKSLSSDLAEDKIRVNAVSPGSIATELGQHTAELKADKDSPATGGNAGRPGLRAEPREIAYVHLFLVSDEASFVNGHSLIADGGRIVIPA
jgi:NAD(P)-dependent dehydrogenase (short-subunit alcohol dehydrogenase family)